MMLSVIVFLAFVGSAMPQNFPADLCCMPPEYEGKIGETGVEGIVNTVPTPYYTFYGFSSSQAFQAVHWTFLELDPLHNRREVLLDFSTSPGTMYTTYNDGSCVQSVNRGRISQGCEIGIANRVFAYYKGVAPDTFDSFSAFDDDEAEFARTYVWDNDCSALFSSMAYVGTDNVFGSYVELFMNVTVGIADTSIFDPPANCPPAADDAPRGDIGLGPLKSVFNIKTY